MRAAFDANAHHLEAFVAGGLAFSGATLVAAARLFPFESLPPLCVFKALTGLPCLTCGMTRAWVAMAHGEPLVALAWNPAGAALFAITCGGVGYLLLRRLGAPALRVRTTRWERRLLACTLALGAAANWAFVASQGRV